MKRRAYLAVLLSFLIAGETAAEGLSTTFVMVTVPDVPLGQSVPLRDRAGRDVVVNNLGKDPLIVRTAIRPPQKHRLLDGAKVIPDISWIHVEPSEQIIPGGSSATFRLTVRVPKKKKYTGKYYQVAVRIRGEPPSNASVVLGGGLLTRLRFKTRKP